MKKSSQVRMNICAFGICASYPVLLKQSPQVNGGMASMFYALLISIHSFSPSLRYEKPTSNYTRQKSPRYKQLGLDLCTFA